jgi:ABC-type uncharacterized transport system
MIRWGSLSQSRSQLFLASAAVVLGGLLLGEVNLLSARRFIRVDVTPDARFTLSEPTRHLLSRLEETVTIYCVLPGSDPRRPELWQILEAYQSESSKIELRALDPERDLTGYMALLSEVEKTTGGDAKSAAVLVRKGARFSLIDGEKLRSSGGAPLRGVFEQGLSEGLARLENTQQTHICFVTGHGEPSLEDYGPEGLGAWSRRLTSLNYHPESVALDVPEPERALADCELIALVAPERPLPKQHVRAMQGRIQAGARLFIALAPIVSEEGRLVSAGLEELWPELGLKAPIGFVLEQDPTRRLPDGIGEAFFTEAAQHPITDGMTGERAQNDLRATVVGGTPLRIENAGIADALLLSSTDTLVVDALIPDAEAEHPGSVCLGAAVHAAADATTPRAVVFSFAHLMKAATLSDPALRGNRKLVERSFDWLSGNPLRASFRPEEVAAMTFTYTEGTLLSVARVALVYLPALSAALGAAFLWRRRRKGALPEGSP